MSVCVHTTVFVTNSSMTQPEGFDAMTHHTNELNVAASLYFETIPIINECILYEFS